MVNDTRVAAKAAAADRHCRQMQYGFAFQTEKQPMSFVP